MVSNILKLSLITALIFLSSCVEQTNNPDFRTLKQPQTLVPISAAGLPIFKVKTLKIMVIEEGIFKNTYLTKMNLPKDHSNRSASMNEHGTHVAGLVLYGNLENTLTPNNTLDETKLDQLCENVEVSFCKIGTDYYPTKCLEKAIAENFNLINYSSSGYGFSAQEFKLWQKFSQSGGVSVVAAGNDRTNLSAHLVFPASWGVVRDHQQSKDIINMYTIDSKDQNNYRLRNSNYNEKIIFERGNTISLSGDNNLAYMNGTSMAAPLFTHKIAKQFCSNQTEPRAVRMLSSEDLGKKFKVLR